MSKFEQYPNRLPEVTPEEVAIIRKDWTVDDWRTNLQVVNPQVVDLAIHIRAIPYEQRIEDVADNFRMLEGAFDSQQGEDLRRYGLMLSLLPDQSIDNFLAASRGTNDIALLSPFGIFGGNLFRDDGNK